MTLSEYGEAIYEYDVPDNLVKLFEVGVEKFSNSRLFGEKNSSGEFCWKTYQEIKNSVDNLRGGLHALGVLKKGDAVGIIANNRSEWFICENAVHGLNCRWVPMYERELLSIWKYIIVDAGIKVLFVSKQEIYEKVKHLIDRIETLEKIILIESSEAHENSYEYLLNRGKKKPIEAMYPDKNDIAVLIYTSGTTGEPKGVLLSHGNLTFCSQSGYKLYSEVLVKDNSILPPNFLSITLNKVFLKNAYLIPPFPVFAFLIALSTALLNIFNTNPPFSVIFWVKPAKILLKTRGTEIKTWGLITSRSSANSSKLLLIAIPPPNWIELWSSAEIAYEWAQGNMFNEYLSLTSTSE